MKIDSRNIAIDKVYKRRDRYEIPDWQREEVWDEVKKQNLIDSILRGWKLPKFYFLKISEDEEDFEVVDGQQRLMAIWEFFDNSLSLSPSSTKDFDGAHYKDLSPRLSDYFDDFEIQYDEITDADDAEIREFFQRLQQGLPLTGSEKLNAVHSNLRNFCRDLSSHQFFANTVAFVDKRYSYFDVVAKVTTVEIEGIGSSLRFDDIKPVFEHNSSFSSQSAVARRIRDAFDYLYRAFPRHSPELRNRSITQSIVTVAARIIETGHSAGSEKRFYNFIKTFMADFSKQVELGIDAADEDFLHFQKSVSANVRGGARIRHQILLKKMLRMDPSLTQLFEPTVIAESGIANDIARLENLISGLIEKINAQYEAKHGEDLLKMTNKTVAALRKIGTKISNYKAYKSFIDDLYFLFWESTGPRLTSKEPVSFVDVNTLRTEIDHDLNHGKKSKIAAKHKKASAVFMKYSGNTTPSTLAPSYFPVAQVNLLEALKEDLLGLLKKI